ncbi:hypothetical protein DPMN_047891 [Dreissena polymorpha]|uniref:Uncharacterized protein n=1 Tax=Dreissena polymorpha TaxID=45954 RepID=A0A9D4DB85_DREPO|nr:hypothetical protein DPMN_047891 [Dreissena polymorpha]
MSLINHKDIHLISSREKGHVRGARGDRALDRYPVQRGIQQEANQDQPSNRRAQQKARNRGNGRARRCERCGNPPHKERRQCSALGETCKNIGDECVNQNTCTMSIMVTVTVKIHMTIIRVINGYNLIT